MIDNPRAMVVAVNRDLSISPKNHILPMLAVTPVLSKTVDKIVNVTNWINPALAAHKKYFTACQTELFFLSVSLSFCFKLFFSGFSSGVIVSSYSS